MARTLIIGGAGFIGRALVEELLDQNKDTIRVLDLRDLPGALAGRVDYIRGSILDDQQLQAAMQGCDSVFHLAAIPELWLPDKRNYLRVNTEGTRRVLNAAARANVSRLVYTSTESIVAGTHKSRSHANESTRASLRDMPGPYCRSKFLAEQAAFKAAREGLPVVIVNPTLPIGAGDERLTPPSRMLLGFLNGEYPAYLDSAFNLIHVRDIARGHRLAAERGTPGQRYMLAGENFRLSELLQLLNELTGIKMPCRRIPWSLAYVFAALSEGVADYITRKPPSAPLTGVRLARHPMFFDNQRARRELGLAVTPIRQALTEAVQDFQQRGLLNRELGKAGR